MAQGTYPQPGINTPDRCSFCNHKFTQGESFGFWVSNSVTACCRRCATTTLPALAADSIPTNIKTTGSPARELKLAEKLTAAFFKARLFAVLAEMRSGRNE